MTGASYVGAVDHGTTGTRFMVFDHDGLPVAESYERHEQHYPKPGWVEHDPIEIWENTKAVITRGLAETDIAADQLAALGITNQRETTLVWDAATGEPVHRAIVWQDRRTTERVESLREAGQDRWIRHRTGLEPDAYFSATKAEWLLDQVRSAGSPGSAGPPDELRFGTMDTWLVANLTGEHVTDVTNASRTMLFDIHDCRWDDELLAEFDIPSDLLPEVRPSSDPHGFGVTDPDGFLGAEVPVAGVLGDQQAALVGQACFERGTAKNTYGTGSFFLLNTGDVPVESGHGLLTTIAFQQAGGPVKYALEGSIFVTGAAIEWLVDIELVENPAETEALAGRVDSTDGVYVVPAFAGLGAPHWDGRARGTIVGMTRATRREHLVRAVLEGIGYQTRDVTEAVEADAGIDIDTLRVGGGAVKNDLLCQLQADILQTVVTRPAVEETTALGAAYAAGLAVDFWASIDDVRDNWRVDREFQPSIPAEQANAWYARWSDAVERAMDWSREEAEPTA